MTEEKPPHSLEELDARLRKAREGSVVRSAGSRLERADRGPLGAAFRIGAELVAAMIVGVGGGYLLDRWLGTSPWGLIVMFFLGSAAGVLNVYRAVSGLGFAPGYGRAHKNEPRRPDGGDTL
jgi:Uncharacterized protein conserved in bacteria